MPLRVIAVCHAEQTFFLSPLGEGQKQLRSTNRWPQAKKGGLSRLPFTVVAALAGRRGIVYRDAGQAKAAKDPSGGPPPPEPLLRLPLCFPSLCISPAAVATAATAASPSLASEEGLLPLLPPRSLGLASSYGKEEIRECLRPLQSRRKASPPVLFYDEPLLFRAIARWPGGKKE